MQYNIFYGPTLLYCRGALLITMILIHGTETVINDDTDVTVEPYVHREEVNIVRQYELVFIIKPDLDEEATDTLIEKVKSIAVTNDAEIVKLEKWGKRRLAYEIKNYREGVYVIMNFKGDVKVSAELDRVLKITENILRHMIVREDEK